MIFFMFQTDCENNFHQLSTFILLYQTLQSGSRYLQRIAGKYPVIRMLTSA